MSERETLQARLRQVDSALDGAALSPAPASKRRGRPPGKAMESKTKADKAEKPFETASAFLFSFQVLRGIPEIRLPSIGPA